MREKSRIFMPANAAIFGVVVVAAIVYLSISNHVSMHVLGGKIFSHRVKVMSNRIGSWGDVLAVRRMAFCCVRYD